MYRYATAKMFCLDVDVICLIATQCYGYNVWYTVSIKLHCVFRHRCACSYFKSGLHVSNEISIQFGSFNVPIIHYSSGMYIYVCLYMNTNWPVTKIKTVSTSLDLPIKASLTTWITAPSVMWALTMELRSRLCRFAGGLAHMWHQ